MEFPSTIEACHDLIHQLLDENTSLRQSGASFGRLAERLNTALQEQRRLARDARVVRRDAEDGHPEPLMVGADRHNASRSPRS